MTTITTTVTGRRIQVDAPEDWPEGTQVELHPIGMSPSADSTAAWRQSILDTAGKWQGEFEQPTGDQYEEREALS